jgi:NAD(P)-dependent dehydrogenase (short-subunit alcohol dehydrogenase family)
MSLRFQDKIAVVIGGNSGIGVAAAITGVDLFFDGGVIGL